MFLTFFLSILLFSQSYAEIRTNKDYTVDGTIIPANSDVLVLGTKTTMWYELYEGKKSVGSVQQDCVSIQGEFLVLTKSCQTKYGVGHRFKKFFISNKSQSQIMFAGKQYDIPSELLSFVRPSNMDPESYEPVSIEVVIKLKKENVIVSSYIDRTMYVSTILGVFTSLDGKKWYRLKKLEQRKYEIAVTQEGWIIADTLVSRDFGKSFEEFFPSFAEPYKDAYVKGILISPQGVNAIYITFSSKLDPSDMTLYMLVSLEQGWRKIYPVADEASVTVPAEGSLSSILKFINNKWLKNNKYSKRGRVDIEEIDVAGTGSSRTVSMMVSTYINGVEKDHHVSLSLIYEIKKGWSVVKEKWSFI